MNFKRLGRTDLQVSSVGLGCGNFGGVGSAPECYGKGEDERQSFALMDAALEQGINFFDTAADYAGGQSEAFVGRWLQTKSPQERGLVLLSSKVGSGVGANPKAPRLSRERIVLSVDKTLQRLGVGRLDMYLIHEPDPNTPLEETLVVLDELVAKGKIRYFGASNFSAELLAESLRVSARMGIRRVEWVQNSYNLLDRSDESELLPMCGENGIGYTPFGPLMGGLLTGKYREGNSYPDGSRMSVRPQPYLKLLTPQTFEAVRRLETAAGRFGVTSAGLAMAWVMHAPQVTAPIIGPRKLSHFGLLREALGVSLSQTEWSEIGDIFRLAAASK